jgi:MFS family permease
MDRTLDERARLVRRTTLLLAVAQAALWGAIGVFAAFGPISAFDISDRESAAPLLFGLYFLGVAAGARVAGSVMDRRGRRPGLVGGYVLMAAGGAGAAGAVAAESVGWLLGAGALIGAGVGPAQLGRTAVADMYPAERRGRAVGTLIVAGTIGAVGGPPLAGGAHALAERIGWTHPAVAAWLMGPVLAVAALACVLAVRPDPRALAIEGSGGHGRRPLEVVRPRPGLVAVVTMGVSQAVMTTFMGVVPVVLRSHGSGEGTISVVVGLHLAGMFAFSRLIGSALDRWGRRPGLLAGAALLVAGVLLSLVTGGTAIPTMGLLLIGIGWSTAFVGSTAVVSDLAAPSERAGALGLTDLVASLSAAAGVFGGAFVLEASGFQVLGVAGLVLLLVPISLMVVLREPAPLQPPSAVPVRGGSAG